MNENLLIEKSFAFALRIVKLYKYLCEEKEEFVLSKQILTSGTDIGKYIKIAVAESGDIFKHEKAKALQKIAETEYWLELLLQANVLGEKQFNSINNDRVEIENMVRAMVETAQKKEV